jgi:CDP-glycerol glycerophosphotransferase (TagB/SpsB family)
VVGPEHSKIIDAHAEGLSVVETLAASSAFVSDYSGGLLDAIAAKIPTVCFADDVEHYVHQLTPDFLTEVPNLVTQKGTDAFVSSIRKVSVAGDCMNAFRNKWVGACDGEVATRVAALVEGC